MECRRIIIPASLQKRTLDQFHVSQVGIEKTMWLVCESIYWINLNSDIENAIKISHVDIDFLETQPKDKVLSQKIPGRLSESVRAGMFSINNKHYLCIANYHSTFPIIKQVVGLSADNVIKPWKIILLKTKYRLSRTLMSEVGTNFVAEEFQDFCRCLYIHHTV